MGSNSGGSSISTSDLIAAKGTNLFTGVGTQTVKFSVIYLEPDTSIWDHSGAWFAAYFYNETTNTNKWVRMTKVSSGVYYCEKPSGYPSVIFVRMNKDATETNWNSKWNQTINLTVQTDGKNCFTITSGSGDSYVGEWKSYSK